MKPFAIPDLSLVILIGPSGSGKSTFASQHFQPTEIVSSDFCRGLISDDENNQEISAEAFDLLYTIVSKRLAYGRLTVIDATNVEPQWRKPLLALAKEYFAVPVGIVFNLPETVCQQRNQDRIRQVPSWVIHQQISQLHKGLQGLQKEGFRYLLTFNDQQDVDDVILERRHTWTNRSDDHGPFDIIGDVHGCCSELENLLDRLGYTFTQKPAAGTYFRHYSHPEGRKAVFLGDLVDRGPRILDSLQLVRNMAKDGQALVVPGNHDVKLVRKFQRRNISVSHGMEATLAEIDALPNLLRESMSKELLDFLDNLVSHYVLDQGNLVVAHAGMKANMQGRSSKKIREFALYGDTTGEVDSFGLPVRLNWAADYSGKAKVVYGHTPVFQPEWVNNTINIDTGCVFGGQLTALRYPEMDLVSVPAERIYGLPARPLSGFPQEMAAPVSTIEPLEILNISEHLVIQTELLGSISIPGDCQAAALEEMSRYAVDPRWLIYLPPTMSPPETSTQPGFLEHPLEAFEYFQKAGVNQVMCQQKHMGSHLVAVVCKDEDTALKRFTGNGQKPGILYTRTGRRFFDDSEQEFFVLNQIRAAVEKSGLWRELDTDWICLDCELMPWSVKALDLIRLQYAQVGAAAQNSLRAAKTTLEQALQNGLPVDELSTNINQRVDMIDRYVSVYRQYCWPIETVKDLHLAPFQILASQGAVHVQKDHLWHMQMIQRLVNAAPDEWITATPYQIIDLSNPEDLNTGIKWWEDLTEAGGEGIVIKPVHFIARSQRKLLLPALKCRGREFLRMIYGPEYTTEENLAYLRKRNLTLKCSLALREYALGVEALNRLVNHQPLSQIHACVFGILALENEPVDPRL